METHRVRNLPDENLTHEIVTSISRHVELYNAKCKTLEPVLALMSHQTDTMEIFSALQEAPRLKVLHNALAAAAKRETSSVTAHREDGRIASEALSEVAKQREQVLRQQRGPELYDVAARSAEAQEQLCKISPKSWFENIHAPSVQRQSHLQKFQAIIEHPLTKITEWATSQEFTAWQQVHAKISPPKIDVLFSDCANFILDCITHGHPRKIEIKEVFAELKVHEALTLWLIKNPPPEKHLK